MDYKDFIKPHERVVYMPDWDNLGWWCDYENCIVEIGEYRPYYTDGSVDPKPEEYNEYCYVEAYPESKKVDNYQFRLNDLHPIQKLDEEISVIYDCKSCKLIGKVLSVEYEMERGFMRPVWEENGYEVISMNGKWLVVSEDDYYIEHDISELDKDQLEKLRTEIRGGSIYTTDYHNSYGVDPNIVCNEYDGFWSFLCDEYGEDDADEHDTPVNFANFILGYMELVV